MDTEIQIIPLPDLGVLSGHGGAADGGTSGLMLTIGQFCLNIIVEIILAAGLSSAHINCLNTDTLIPH